MPDGSATIYDVADAAGVSISTVSKVVNRPDTVSAGTRDRVLAAIDRLSYVPRSEAVSRARSRMNRVAVVAPFTSDSSYFRRLDGILREGARAHIEVSVFSIESAATATSPQLATIPVQGQFDGLLVMGAPLEPTTEARLRERGLPTVLVDATSDTLSVVEVDDTAGGRIAAAHLLELGHTSALFVLQTQVADFESPGIRRLNGFRSRFLEERADLSIIESAPDPRSVRTTLIDALSTSARRPTAVVAMHDQMAVGALEGLRGAGLRVPDDVSVVGFDDGLVARAADLTSVRQPFEESGEVALRRLLTEMKYPGSTRSVIALDLGLTVRGSTAPPPKVLSGKS